MGTTQTFEKPEIDEGMIEDALKHGWTIDKGNGYNTLKAPDNFHYSQYACRFIKMEYRNMQIFVPHYLNREEVRRNVL